MTAGPTAAIVTAITITTIGVADACAVDVAMLIAGAIAAASSTTIETTLAVGTVGGAS